MTKLWFSYSAVNGLDSSEPPNSPYTITWHLGRYLRSRAAEQGWQFEYRNLDDKSPADIKAGDICLGHTWWDGGFMDLALDSAARKYIIQPYQHYMVSEPDIPRLKIMFAKADHLFLITGPYWWETMPNTPFAEWRGKATRLDMAINPDMHPHSKTRWNPRGKRRFLCMGNDMPYKGLDLIAELFQMSGYHLGYYGNAGPARFQHVPSFTNYGGAVMDISRQQAITAEYDFFISLGRADANPTTLLESGCWGLLPVCNERSGYKDRQPFWPIEYPLSARAVIANLETLDELQAMSENTLRTMTDNIRAHVVKWHSWQHFCWQVWRKILDDENSCR